MNPKCYKDIIKLRIHYKLIKYYYMQGELINRFYWVLLKYCSFDRHFLKGFSPPFSNYFAHEKRHFWMRETQIVRLCFAENNKQ